MMKKHLNNKGYMLVEIILAFAIAMGVMYFLMELTIKLKNKNDDLLVRTLASTDQAIIYNAIMKDVYGDSIINYCNKLSISGQKFTYGGFTNIVSEYAKLGTETCTYTEVYDDDSMSTTISVNLTIPIYVKQMSNEDFNVVIKHTKVINH